MYDCLHWTNIHVRVGAWFGRAFFTAAELADQSRPSASVPNFGGFFLLSPHNTTT
jgi:hypothetical protein